VVNLNIRGKSEWKQYPLKVGDREFFIDLLFYNVRLHCYFVVELKIVEFEPEFAGKLSFYLSVIDGELKTENDNLSFDTLVISVMIALSIYGFVLKVALNILLKNSIDFDVIRLVFLPPQ
jgi:hypothetical protein